MKKRTLKENVRPEGRKIVTVKAMGNITEIKSMTVMNTECHILKIDKDSYVVKSTGEIKKFEHHCKRVDDINNLRVTLGRLRALIATNVLNTTKCRWVTLTYAQPDGKPMVDSKKLYTDFKKFRQKLSRKLKRQFEYISIIEPQRSSSYHFHCILIFLDRAPYIDGYEMGRIWGHGYANVRAIDSCDNIGAYVSAYMTDLELSDEEYAQDTVMNSFAIDKKQVDKDGKEQTKKIIKGGRLHFYPAGMQIYRCSKGIKSPEISKMTEKEAQIVVAGAPLTYEKTIYIYDDDIGFSNTINYRYYNRKRQGTKENQSDS